MREFLIVSFSLITLYFGIQLLRGLYYNNLLKNKKQGMRVDIEVPAKPSLFNWAKVLVPASALAIAIIINPQLEFTPSLNGVEIGVLENESDLRQLLDEYQSNGFFARDGVTVEEVMTMEVAESESAVDMDSGAALEKGASEYTETNVQVVGVDEIDNVKTDGTFIYQIRHDQETYQNELLITLAYPTDELSVFKRLGFTNDYDCWNSDQEVCVNEYPQGIYVDEDRLIVVVSRNTWINNNAGEVKEDVETTTKDTSTDEVTIIEPGYFMESTQQTIVYVLDKHNNFETIDEYAFEGYMIGTRKIGDDLFLITNNWINSEEDELIPQYSVNGNVTNPGYESVTYLRDTNPYSFTSIYGIDLNESTVDVENMLGGSSSTIYVSTNSIYTLDQRFWIEPRIALLETEDAEFDPNESISVVTRFSLDGNDISFAAAGEIKGYPLNQFSMDERDTYLRITTTTGWGEYTNNRLIVLNNDMTIVAELENLGKPNERLQSTRFVGDTAYLVTFERTDPFYVIDLSDPLNPEIKGELEITGFSSYMQPIDANHILGIGFEADLDGRVIGMKLAIYDVTDPTNPLELSKEVLLYEEMGWNWSSVTYNHKDLLLDINKGLIGFPFSSEVYENNKYNWQSGYLLYSFEDLNLTKEAYITHGVSENYWDYMQKGLFLDEYFYTIANNHIGVSHLDDLGKLLELIELNK